MGHVGVDREVEIVHSPHARCGEVESHRPPAAVALLAFLFLKEVPLRTTVSVTEEATAAVATGTGAGDVSRPDLTDLTRPA